MKQAVLTRYGTPDDVEIREVEIEKPSQHGVLVKVKAASLNATDIELIRGDAMVRITNGLRKPKNPRLGCDLSGVVDSIGDKVTNFRVGDEVYVDVMYQTPAYGSLTEYIIVPENRLRLKPAHLTFEEAATIPQAGTLAVQGITEPNEPDSSSSVLVNGAGGGVGSYGVQLAKYFGANVTAVDHPDKLDFLKNIGADKVYSYIDTDFTKLEAKFDIILDPIARKSTRAYRRALSEHGRYRMVGAPLHKIIGVGLGGYISSKFSSKDVGLLLGRPNDKESMEFLSRLIKEKEIIPQIGDVYPLEKVREGLWKLAKGESRGKIVITMT